MSNKCEEKLHDELDVHQLIIKLRQFEALIQDDSFLELRLKEKLKRFEKQSVVLETEMSKKFSSNLKQLFEDRHKDAAATSDSHNKNKSLDVNSMFKK